MRAAGFLASALALLCLFVHVFAEESVTGSDWPPITYDVDVSRVVEFNQTIVTDTIVYNLTYSEGTIPKNKFFILMPGRLADTVGHWRAWRVSDETELPFNRAKEPEPFWQNEWVTAFKEGMAVFTIDLQQTLRKGDQVSIGVQFGYSRAVESVLINNRSAGLRMSDFPITLHAPNTLRSLRVQVRLPSNPIPGTLVDPLSSFSRHQESALQWVTSDPNGVSPNAIPTFSVAFYYEYPNLHVLQWTRTIRPGLYSGYVRFVEDIEIANEAIAPASRTEYHRDELDNGRYPEAMMFLQLNVPRSSIHIDLRDRTGRINSVDETSVPTGGYVSLRPRFPLSAQTRTRFQVEYDVPFTSYSDGGVFFQRKYQFNESLNEYILRIPAAPGFTLPIAVDNLSVKLEIPQGVPQYRLAVSMTPTRVDRESTRGWLESEGGVMITYNRSPIFGQSMEMPLELTMFASTEEMTIVPREGAERIAFLLCGTVTLITFISGIHYAHRRKIEIRLQKQAAKKED